MCVVCVCVGGGGGEGGGVVWFILPSLISLTFHKSSNLTLLKRIYKFISDDIQLGG